MVQCANGCAVDKEKGQVCISKQTIGKVFCESIVLKCWTCLLQVELLVQTRCLAEIFPAHAFKPNTKVFEALSH